MDRKEESVTDYFTTRPVGIQEWRADAGGEGRLEVGGVKACLSSWHSVERRRQRRSKVLKGGKVDDR